MGDNEFKLLGRVGWIDIQYKENKNSDLPTVITKINLGVKTMKKDAENKAIWENFFITFFNKKNHPTAELLGEEVHEGDYIRVDGKLTISSFTPPGKDKPVQNVQLLGWGYKKVRFDEGLKKFVDVEVEEETIEEAPPEPAGEEYQQEQIVEFGDDDDEMPF